MKTIYKYKVGETHILPISANALTANIQDGQIFVWIELDTEEFDKEDREYVVFGTGWEMPEDKDYLYVSSVFDSGFVWHVYQVL